MLALFTSLLFVAVVAENDLNDFNSASVDCNAFGEDNDMGENSDSGLLIDCASNNESQLSFPNLGQAVAALTMSKSNASLAAKIDVAKVKSLTYSGFSTEIPDKAFSSFIGLRDLIIDFSQEIDQLKDGQSQPSVTIKPNAFKGLENVLKNLELIGVHLDQGGFPIAIRSLSALQYLKLSDCNLNGQLKSSDLQNFKNFTKLILSGSPNFAIADDAFSNNAETLEDLHLKTVKLSNFPTSISSLKKLDEIQISDTELEFLPANAFKGSGGTLKELLLQDNDIVDIDPDAFKNLSSLTLLVLMGNEISNIPEGVFDDLTSLTMMQLGNNNLTTTSLKNVFLNTNSLQQLSLAFNQLDSVTAELLNGIEDTITSIDLSYNAISSVHGTIKLTQSPQLILSSNGIETLKPTFFESGSNFSRLYLDNNPISQIQPGAFDGVAVEGVFSIDNTDLVDFDLSSLSGLKGAQSLIIVNNLKLRSIKVTSANTVPSTLTSIVVSRNPKFVLTDPDGQLASFLQKFKVRLVISDNVYCHCELGWIRDKWPQAAGDRKSIISFETTTDETDSTSPTQCCNFAKTSVEDFLSDSVFNQRCGTTKRGNTTFTDNDSCRHSVSDNISS